MTDRLGLLERSQLSPEQVEVYDVLVRYTDAKYNGIFKSRDEQGRFLGPFGIMLHTPEVAKAYLPLIRSIAGIEGLPADAREVAILVVGARTGAKYETYAHEPVSGFPREDLDDILAGKCPGSFTGPKKIAYRVATALGEKGPLDQGLWDEAINIFGKQGATALIHYVGFYGYIAVLLNGFDASIPE